MFHHNSFIKPFVHSSLSIRTAHISRVLTSANGASFALLLNKCMLSIYLFIRHTPSNEYYVPGSPQHAIKVKDKNKADSKKGIKVHSVSVLYSRKESEDKNSSCQFMV